MAKDTRPARVGTLQLPSRMTARASRETINIANPSEYTMLQLAENVLRLIGPRSRLVFQPDDYTASQMFTRSLSGRVLARLRRLVCTA